MLSLLFVITLVALSSANNAKLLHCDSPTVIKGHYIVEYNNSVSVERSEYHIASNGIQTTRRYTETINGFAAALTEAQVQALLKDNSIKHVECDQVVSVADCSKVVERTSWGLTRIAETQMSLNGRYAYPTKGQFPVSAYILDTGIYVEHNDFGGRAKFGWKAETSWSNTDASGHGTHVASTVGGTFYGVCPYADEIIAVKVLGDNGSGSNAGVIAGVEWVGKQDKANTGKNSVANLSLGGGKSTSLNNAINTLAASVVVVVAAGNENQDACDVSPASAAAAVTVCSTTISVTNGDQRSSFSNYGKCVDICAPGSAITAAWIGSPNAIRTISGTSMASPHVAGVAALKLSNEKLSAPAVKALLLSDATAGTIDMACGSSSICRQTPDKMLFNGCNA